MLEKQALKANHDQGFAFWPWLLSVLRKLFGFEPKRRETDTEVKSAASFAADNVQANWSSIFKTMDHWVVERGTVLADPVPPRMLALAQEARYFSHKYASFLSEVPIDEAVSHELSQTKLRNLALERVLEEWDTIRQALEQRESPRYQVTLNELDNLAFECLAPLFDEKKLQRGVFAYFHKLFDIKRFVFSRTPLVGAPFSALHSPEDWLAIPHEAGHYIFWNGTETFASFNQFYLTLQNEFIDVINSHIGNRITGRALHHKGEIFQIWLNWMQEIFADVFGTLIAGPAFAWSIQSNLRASLSEGDLMHNHDEPDHPDPFIRPFFHISVLREMGMESGLGSDFAGQLNNSADALEASWRASWAKDITTKLPTPDSVGSMEMVLKDEVPAVVRVILDANLGENLSGTLRGYLRNGVLYNYSVHQEVMEFANQIQRGTRPEIDSPLKKCIAARLAIVNGMDPIEVHRVLGYPGPEQEPAYNETLEREFETFIKNVTGQDSRAEQLKAFRRVLNYSLQEQDFHWHNHPHSH